MKTDKNTATPADPECTTCGDAAAAKPLSARQKWLADHRAHLAKNREAALASQAEAKKQADGPQAG